MFDHNTQRRALRRAVELPCEVITPHVDEPRLHWMTDLTPHGTWLETAMPLEVGEIIVVSFTPAVWWMQRELTLFAAVTRVAQGMQRSGMGVEFLDITPHERRALAFWLHRRPPPLPRRRARGGAVERLPQPRQRRSCGAQLMLAL